MYFPHFPVPWRRAHAIERAPGGMPVGSGCRQAIPGKGPSDEPPPHCPNDNEPEEPSENPDRGTAGNTSVAGTARVAIRR